MLWGCLSDRVSCKTLYDFRRCRAIRCNTAELQCALDLQGCMNIYLDWEHCQKSQEQCQISDNDQIRSCWRSCRPTTTNYKFNQVLKCYTECGVDEHQTHLFAYLSITLLALLLSVLFTF